MSYTIASSSASIIEFNNPQPANPPKAAWHRPKLIEVIYPTSIAGIRDLHHWIEAMMLDAKLTGGDKTILTRLALHLNLKTGRCNPGVGRLAMEVSVHGTDPERAVRRSLAKSEKRGWIRRTFRHGGDAKRQSQTNDYTLTIPDWTTGLQSPGEQIERPDKTTTSDRTKCAFTTGLQSPPNSEVVNSEDRTAKLIANKRDSNSDFKGNPRKEGKEVRQQSDTPTNSNSPSLNNPTPPVSARAPSPLLVWNPPRVVELPSATRERIEAEATLEEYRKAAKGGGVS